MKSTNDTIGSTKTKLNSGFIRRDLKKKKKRNTNIADVNTLRGHLCGH